MKRTLSRLAAAAGVTALACALMTIPASAEPAPTPTSIDVSTPAGWSTMSGAVAGVLTPNAAVVSGYLDWTDQGRSRVLWRADGSVEFTDAEVITTSINVDSGIVGYGSKIAYVPGGTLAVYDLDTRETQHYWWDDHCVAPRVHAMDQYFLAYSCANNRFRTLNVANLATGRVDAVGPREAPEWAASGDIPSDFDSVSLLDGRLVWAMRFLGPDGMSETLGYVFELDTATNGVLSATPLGPVSALWQDTTHVAWKTTIGGGELPTPPEPVVVVANAHPVRDRTMVKFGESEPFGDGTVTWRESTQPTLAISTIDVTDPATADVTSFAEYPGPVASQVNGSRYLDIGRAWLSDERPVVIDYNPQTPPGLVTPRPLTPLRLSPEPRTGQETIGGADTQWEGEGLTFYYAWYLDGWPIPGAQSDRYTPTAAQRGHALIFEVTAVSAAGLIGVAQTVPTTIQGSPLAPANVVAPFIGYTQAGVAVTGHVGQWSGGGITYRYAWYVDGRVIRGANTASYTPTAGQRGKSLQFEVTAVNEYGAKAVVCSVQVIR